MGPINYKLAFYWAFIFSAAVFLTGCDDEEKPEGFELYSAKCSSCHRLLPPENYSLEKLKEYIAKYGKEMTLEEKGQLMDILKKYKLLKEKE